MHGEAYNTRLDNYGSGSQLQEQVHTTDQLQTSQSNKNNYILPTFSNKYGAAVTYNGDVYADVSVEQDKKNLLTLPTDPNQMYIKKKMETPTAEVILYPMGQLLAAPRQQQGQILNSPRPADYLEDPMSAAGSSTRDILARPARDQMPATVPSKPDTNEEGQGGILQTIMRTAKDDISLVSNVLKHLTGS